MLIDLTGRAALVTGASSGLGAHFAEVLAKAGAHVAIAARRTDRLEALAARLADAGRTVTVIEMDVADRASIAAAIERAEDALGRIDILVNNAGVTRTKPALDYDEEDFDEIVDVNLRGAFLVAQRVARAMQGSGGGSIVNIASILGLRQAGQVASYAISKAGVIQMTKVQALEWARHGIRVNAIAPGYVDTELNADFWESDAGKALVKRIPQRRLGRLEDLDGALLLLASELSAYMTGSVITVDGGHLVSTL
ncbi:SDR family NAD(P)-dependent oxidoreductase [Flavisphingomonas formosensis]|uniref:SDR family NAD(P)-dependent oxidoreductase n=1 Tax=Flavisphingomonas formosensis TaxID=861534 RepID=UPI0012F84E86|nr:glucose 1-dehydrogenase [Sphingomonas formosensis]